MCEIPANSFKSDKATGETLKLYEQIVIKNFQILKTILPRMNSLYQLNEQLQRSVSNIQTRLVKMQNDQENLHYEMRTSHLAIDSKLNSIISEYNNITNQTNKVKKQTELLSREVRQAKFKPYIDRSEKQLKTENQGAFSKENTKQRPKRIAFAQKDEVFPTLLKNRPKGIQIPKRSSISIDNEDSPSKSPKVHFSVEAASERQSIAAQNNIAPQSVNETSRKKTFKSKKSAFNASSAQLDSAKSQKQIKTSKSLQQNEGKSFQKFLKEIENYHFHNQKMKQNYEELMEDYCKANQSSFLQLNQKIDTLNVKWIELDPKNNLTESIKANINLQLNPKFQQIKSKLQEKIDRGMFQRIITDFNTRIMGIHEERKKIANRQQTKKALQFLQKKINGVLNDYYEVKQRSLHHVSVDKKGCLRVADLLDQGQKEYNRQNVMLQAHTINNTPRTIRNESAHIPKRQASSLHGRILNGTMTENRFNEKEGRSIITEKADPQEQVPTHRKQSSNKNINLLKKKAYQMLDKEKAKERPKLRKQRLIFQYD